MSIKEYVQYCSGELILDSVTNIHNFDAVAYFSNLAFGLLMTELHEHVSGCDLIAIFADSRW